MAVLVLGATGMLGHGLLHVLSPGFDIVGNVVPGCRPLRARTPGAPE